MSEINTNTPDRSRRPSLSEWAIANPDKAGNRVGLAFVLALLLPYLYEVATSPESEVATVNPGTSVTVEENPSHYPMSETQKSGLRNAMSNAARAIIGACVSTVRDENVLTCDVQLPDGEHVTMNDVADMEYTGWADMTAKYGIEYTSYADGTTAFFIKGQPSIDAEGKNGGIESARTSMTKDERHIGYYIEHGDGSVMKAGHDIAAPERGSVFRENTDDSPLSSEEQQELAEIVDRALGTVEDRLTYIQTH